MTAGYWIGAFQQSHMLLQVLMLLLGVLLVGLLAWIVSRFWSGPLLEIDEAGIRSRTPAFYLPWTGVESVRLRRVPPRPHWSRPAYQLVIRPVDSAALHASPRKTLRNPMLTALGSAWIPLNLLAVRPDEIAAAVENASGIAVARTEAQLSSTTWDDA